MMGSMNGAYWLRSQVRLNVRRARCKWSALARFVRPVKRSRRRRPVASLASGVGSNLPQNPGFPRVHVSDVAVSLAIFSQPLNLVSIRGRILNRDVERHGWTSRKVKAGLPRRFRGEPCAGQIGGIPMLRLRRVPAAAHRSQPCAESVTGLLEIVSPQTTSPVVDTETVARS